MVYATQSGILRHELFVSNKERVDWDSWGDVSSSAFGFLCGNLNEVELEKPITYLDPLSTQRAGEAFPVPCHNEQLTREHCCNKQRT